MGNAQIKSKSLNFNTANNAVCTIHGNLDYSAASELNIPDGIVLGEKTFSKYVDNNSLTNVLITKLISYVGFLVYVFVLALLFKRIAPQFIERLSKITLINISSSFGIGLIVLLLLLPFSLVLLLTKLTMSLAFTLLAALLLIALITIPLFVLSIANAWKSEKLNEYIKILIVTTIIFIVKMLPTIGTLLIFIFSLIGLGRILLTLFKKD